MDKTLGLYSRSQVFGSSVQGDQRWFSWSRAWRCHPSSERSRVPHPTPFAGSERCRAGRARKTAWTPCRAAYEPYPFSETDYYRASLQLVQIADVVCGGCSGFFRDPMSFPRSSCCSQQTECFPCFFFSAWIEHGPSVVNAGRPSGHCRRRARSCPLCCGRHAGGHRLSHAGPSG